MKNRMGIMKSLESLAMKSALAFAMSVAGCSGHLDYNLSPAEKQLFSEVYYMSEERQKDCRGDIKMYLDDFSSNKRVYLQEADNFPWMNKKSMTQKDKLFLVVRKKVRDAEEISRKYKEMSQSPHRNLYPTGFMIDANQKSDGGF